MEIFLLLGGIGVTALTACYLDAKYQWRINDWMNGQCSNPFATTSSLRADIKHKDNHIAQLQARIETLEAIVTEPAYELNKKINALK